MYSTIIIILTKIYILHTIILSAHTHTHTHKLFINYSFQNPTKLTHTAIKYHGKSLPFWSKSWAIRVLPQEHYIRRAFQPPPLMLTSQHNYWLSLSLCPSLSDSTHSTTEPIDHTQRITYRQTGVTGQLMILDYWEHSV